MLLRVTYIRKIQAMWRRFSRPASRSTVTTPSRRPAGVSSGKCRALGVLGLERRGGDVGGGDAQCVRMLERTLSKKLVVRGRVGAHEAAPR